jgi:hypothetical protein
VASDGATGGSVRRTRVRLALWLKAAGVRATRRYVSERRDRSANGKTQLHGPQAVYVEGLGTLFTVGSHDQVSPRRC